MKIEDLVSGNYYVYTKYGICQYVKPEIIKNYGVDKQFYTFYFKNKRQCFLVKDQIDKCIFFYADKDKKDVKLSNMDNNKSWKKRKQKTMAMVHEEVSQLTKLYAERKNIKGYALKKNTIALSSFLKLYPYQLTDGQLQALNEVNEDLESDNASSILLSGSVGCGKSTIMQCITFKCINSDYQACILAPTEILAKQHLSEFTEIFKSYKNVNIVFVSGSVSKKKKELIKEQVESGTANIIIGTSSILSQGYKFFNLGLVVTDEEQKFSTKQKELLKTIDPKINQVLVTGTSIPRTTYMAKIGLLHKVSIDSVPKNKKEPEIELYKHNDEKIVQFIKRELDRNGQVYYVLNDTLGLYKVREHLLELNKKYNMKNDLRIGIVNGKLKKKESNQIFDDFKQGKYDILIATTIIEIGLTCGNANSIVIQKCDRFGLSSLIQMDGRVGRSGVQPYVLLTYEGELNQISKKRINIILKHTELNNATAISEADEKLRGSGQLMTGSQHGHMVQIGMDMYNHLLEEEMNKQLKELA